MCIYVYICVYIVCFKCKLYVCNTHTHTHTHIQNNRELPEEFIWLDKKWYEQFRDYIDEQILLRFRQDRKEELALIAAIFSSFAERNDHSHFVSLVQKLLTSNNSSYNLIGLMTLNSATTVFGNAISKYNNQLGPCLSPLSRIFFLTYLLFCPCFL